ncbi:MAG: HipA domain-containing protein [Candidatus Omnitrophica bacterium]|nr:HipA domain-containing protein [Candidatus Omnitrophota bacterium]
MDNAKLLKKIFNIPKWPSIDFSLSEVSLEAQELAGKLSISGVQPKLSVKLDRRKNALISTIKGGEFILKPQTSVYPNIPENEQCCMDMAAALGIAVPDHCLLPLKDNSLAYIVKRYDRNKVDKYNQEDFQQILEKDDKYMGSVEEICRAINSISAVPGLDVQLLYERVIFNFIIGNGDAHFKNYSMITYNDIDRRLAPAYDLVCSKLIIPKGKDSALAINGKQNNLKRKDFDILGDYCKIPEKIRYEKFDQKFDIMRKMIESSQVDQEKKKNFIEIIKERLHRLKLSE